VWQIVILTWELNLCAKLLTHSLMNGKRWTILQITSIRIYSYSNLPGLSFNRQLCSMLLDWPAHRRDGTIKASHWKCLLKLLFPYLFDRVSDQNVKNQERQQSLPLSNIELSPGCNISCIINEVYNSIFVLGMPYKQRASLKL